MPTKPEGVYCDGRGGWYFKANLGKDPLTGKRAQVTKRGFRTAAAAGRARRELLDRADKYMVTAGSSSLRPPEVVPTTSQFPRPGFA